MKLEIDELELQQAFNSFCKKVLRNEAINAQVASQSRKNTIVNFSDLNINEEMMAGADDLSSGFETEYSIQGRRISNAQLIRAINGLNEAHKRIIELYYFYEINDHLISELMQIPRSTVQSWRAKALKLLREDLEDCRDVCNTDI